ncbi:hypothetical protein ACFVT5_01750 [Streptomyces sp. NPDC058001]|uniref:hypothetical protein n=1 Tax=Streptomyces sp. NPDC058001 TaxID=3346300 RepID=UPI0036F0E687
MSKAKNTVAAAAAAIKRDIKKPAPRPDQTQGALMDRRVRHHTPDSLYGIPEDDE